PGRWSSILYDQGRIEVSSRARPIRHRRPPLEHEGRAGQSALCDLPPEVGKRAARWVATPDEHLKLARQQRRTRTGAIARRPLAERPLREPPGAEPEPATVVEENAEHVAPAVAEDEERSAHRLLA